ncbi:unnamed protein product, partial [Rotaria magnacalcarata]
SPEDIPIFNHIRSTAYRRRSSVLPPIPKTLEDIVIPDSLKFLQNGDRYVTFDNPVPNRLIILCSSETLLALTGKCSYWLADGTFRTAPQKFLQSYSIHGRTQWGIHAFVHIAMCGRTQQQYELIFQALLHHANTNHIQLQPLSFISSFQNTDAKRELANLFGLPLIPLQHIFTIYEEIAAKFLLIIADIQPLLQYFSRTYLYGTNFPPPRWNHFSSIGFTDRTNNALEGYHRSINAELDELTMISVSQLMKQKRSTKTQRKRYRYRD